MLHQLVESKKNSTENVRKGEYFLTTLAVLVSVLAGSWTYSLYAKDYAMSGALDMTSLVAPVALAPETPPQPEPQLKPEKTQAVKSNQVILTELYEDVGRGNPPKETAGEKDVVSARRFNLDDVRKGMQNVIPTDYAGRRDNGAANSDGLTNSVAQTRASDDDGEDLKVVKPTPKEEKKAPAPPKSLGVVNGIARNLVTPPYPAAARQIRASGAVNVQVLIDERGNVISATAVSGHPLLRGAAVDAAKQSKFTPTLLSGQPVKVTGVIVYNFKAQ